MLRHDRPPACQTNTSAQHCREWFKKHRLAVPHVRYLAGWYTMEAFPPEDAMILDIREAEDTALGLVGPSKALHAGTLVAAQAIELLVF